MANISFNGAVRAIVEQLEWRTEDENFSGDDPDSVFETLLEWAREALSQYIDNGLIYTVDILELWDGSTHEQVVIDRNRDLMDMVTESVAWQLHEGWADAVFDGADEWLTTVTGKDDRAEALDVLTGETESQCPACGEFIQYCQGHGEIGDPHGAAILAKHDDGDHSDCVIEDCD